MIFEDARDHDDVTIENVDSIRAEYKKRIAEHNQALQELTLHQGWSFVQHRTDLALETTLAEIWQLVSFHLQGVTIGGGHAH